MCDAKTVSDKNSVEEVGPSANAPAPSGFYPERPKRIDTVSAAVTALATIIGVLVGYYAGRQSDETARIIGINNLSSRVESVMDSHQGSRACSRYVVKLGLVDALYNAAPVRSLDDGKLPDDPSGDKEDCLAGIYRTIPYDAAHPVPEATKWDYAREQIMSFINIVDAAAALTTVQSFETFEKEKYKLSESEKVLVEMLDGIVDGDTKALLREWTAAENRDNAIKHKPNKKLEDIWKVCRVVDCEAP
jgi:hypothetical protein